MAEARNLGLDIVLEQQFKLQQSVVHIRSKLHSKNDGVGVCIIEGHPRLVVDGKVVHLPCPISVRKQPICQMVNTFGQIEKHIVVKFSMDVLQNGADLPHSVIPASTEFFAQKILPLSCRKCKNTIISDGSICKSMALPSEHWLELAELWICHPIEGENQAYGVDFKIIKSQAGKLLVSKEYYLVHQSDCTKGSLVDRESLLECAKCLNLIGAISKEEEGYRLFKYALCSKGGIIDEIYTPERCAVEQMMEARSSHRQHRFILYDILQKRDWKLQITVFDWDIALWNSSWNEFRCKGAIKVLFKKLFDASDEKSTSFSEKAYPLGFSSSALDEIHETLRNNHLALPESVRVVNHQLVSYLCR